MNALAIAIAIPIFFGMIGVEQVLARRRGLRAYRFQDSITSLDCGVVQQASAIFFRFVILGIYAWVVERWALLRIEPGIATWIALFLLVDLAYYWFHRASHRVNAIWATHVVHHQSEEYNLSTALRQGATQAIAAAPFYWPIALLGFPLWMFVAAVTANTLYQFWIHTRLVGKLPRPIEWVMNTPSHHRVHHGIDPEYIDKNYAGVFIVWDRLFGTFTEETFEPSYGTVKPLSSWSPIWANLEIWARCWDVARRTSRFRDKLWIWLAPPEWLPLDLGGPVTIPKVDRETRELYSQPGHPSLHRYVTIHFAILGAATGALLLLLEIASFPQLAALAVWIIASTAAWGGLFERKRWAVPLEIGRLAAAPLLAAWIAGANWAAAPAGAVALASLAWLARIARVPDAALPATLGER